MNDARGKSLEELRAVIRAVRPAPRQEAIRKIADGTGLSIKERETILEAAVHTVRQARARSSRSLLASLLAEYRRSSRDGVALMRLAEALPRIPDGCTANAFILERTDHLDWDQHLNRSSSMLVNASALALMFWGRIYNWRRQESLFSPFRGIITRRMGDLTIQTAVEDTLAELGDQFIVAETMEEAMQRSMEMTVRGYVYSYDMLGEAARTQSDADENYLAYSNALNALLKGEITEESITAALHGDAARTILQRDKTNLHENPGISVKLSALHPRCSFGRREQAVDHLKTRCISLALLAKSGHMGMNLDAEESERMDLSLDVVEAVLSESSLAGWDGFGVVVQAYSQRAPALLDWIYALAERLDRRIMVRLVKGAYWNREIKRAQVLGLEGFPVFTRKSDTDLAYIACARKMLNMRDRIYPQFATHDAHTIHAVLHMAGDTEDYELQRLHGMGADLHEYVRLNYGTHCRIYAPVGGHGRLLPYLARGLLENGTNASFVNQVVKSRAAPEEVVVDPFAASLDAKRANLHPVVSPPGDLFAPARANSRGWDWEDPLTIERLDEARAAFKDRQWRCGPLIKEAEGEERKDDPRAGSRTRQPRESTVCNPAFPDRIVGTVEPASTADAERALEAAELEWAGWRKRSVEERAGVLESAADLYEEHAPELFELLIQESGKTLPDAVCELRGAVDFLRYYAEQARLLPRGHGPLGVFVCISPWNLPLAVFTGQAAAALVVGNVVLAKPSEHTPLIAGRAASLLHEAGVPAGALQLLPDGNGEIGALLVRKPGVKGVCFTGSLSTAQAVHRSMAECLSPRAPLIAETGGVNAMIVDSTALTEQATDDILASAFGSAGQRCSAVRVLYVQRECEDQVLETLFGAMDELQIGDPGRLSTDVGPMISAKSKDDILAYVAQSERQAKCLKTCAVPDAGHFAPPSVMGVWGIEEVKREIFGPVLHVATFEAAGIDGVLEDINAHGYGLTIGLHSRIDENVQSLLRKGRVGNMYVNRDQTGAAVGSQPFGGEGLSGTGPKAGGPNYLPRFCRAEETAGAAPRRSGQPLAVETDRVREALQELSSMRWKEGVDNSAELAKALRASHLPMSLPVFGAGPFDLPGPAGEDNRLFYVPRGVALCLGLEEEEAFSQALAALAVGGSALVMTRECDKAKAWFAGVDAPVKFLQGTLPAGSLENLKGFDVVCCRGKEDELRPYARALAARRGQIIQLVANTEDLIRFIRERHLCIDTTSAGADASPPAAEAA